MPDLDAKSDHDHDTKPRGLAGAGGGGGAADPSGATHGWWNTPASLVGPPAVNPAIYGIDASDVGGEGSLDAYVGIGGSTMQAGTGPEKTLKDHISGANGGRANAMNAQLRLAALTINESVAKIRALINASPDERGADGVLAHVREVFQSAEAERDRLALVFKQNLKEGTIRDGLRYVVHASHELDRVKMEIGQFAGRHGLVVKDIKDAKKVHDEVGRLEALQGSDPNDPGLRDERATESALQFESLQRSLDGLVESTDALVLAMSETPARPAVQAIMPGLHSNMAMLEVSLVDGIRPKSDLLAMGRRIRANIAKAWLDGGPLGVQGDLTRAHQDIPTLLNRLEKLAKGRAK